MIAHVSFLSLSNYIKFFYYENIHEYTKEELCNEFPCTSLSFNNYYFFQSSVINLLHYFVCFLGSLKENSAYIISTINTLVFTPVNLFICC